MFGININDMEEIIKTEKLTKKFGNVLAVDSISINVRKGEIYGFLGLNGAGKTTTIRMLLGMINPTFGNAFIDGKKVYASNHKLWKEIGYLVEIPYSYPELTVKENLEISRKLRQLKNKDPVSDIINKLKLTKYTNRKAKNLSLGNSQRLGLAKALIHKPKILMLDEPANGLDPAGIFEIREMLHDLAFNRGVTIIISSHILGEISKFATRIGIIHEGKMIQEINTEDLKNYCDKKLIIKTTNNSLALSVLQEKGLIISETEHDILEIRDTKAIQNPEEIAVTLVRANVPPSMLKVEEEDLESYFLRTIKTKQR